MNGSILLATPWYSANATGTPDYYHSCAVDPEMDVPRHTAWNGYQYALTGDGYAAINAYIRPDIREYIQVQLTEPLDTGENYVVRFFVNRLNRSVFSIDRMGALFTETAVSSPGSQLINLIPQIENPVGDILSDTVDWQEVSGCYMAMGGELFMTIGNFYDDATTSFDSVPSVVPVLMQAYYYVDDVLVMEIPAADAGPDQFVCSEAIQIGTSQIPGSPCSYSWLPGTGLSDSTIAQPYALPSQTTVYTLTQITLCDTTISTVTVHITNTGNCDEVVFSPNPTNGQLSLTYTLSGETNEISIFNSAGQIVEHIEVASGFKQEQDLDLNRLSNGVYVYHVLRDGETFLVDKFIIAK